MLHGRKTWNTLHSVMRPLKKGNEKSKEMVSISLVRQLMEYGAACCDPYRG